MRRTARASLLALPSTLLTSLISPALLLPPTHAAYTLTDSFSQDTFFGNFSAFSGADPTNGFVQYQTYDSATTKSLIHTVPNANYASYIIADPTSSTTKGRDSVRISSTKSFNKGLFILDLLHMPKNVCGSWPAFWLLGPDWPKGGEIDILEGVNAQQGNQMTLHTSEGCSLQPGGFSGKLETQNCGPDEKNTGCAITSADPSGFGDGFNRGNGGVYATEWTGKDISIWFFPREKIPSDISSGNPTPEKWGQPVAKFGGSSCDVESHFKDMKIVFNTAFCGDWAGKVWQSGGCAAATGVAKCEDFVGQHPEAFKESFWLVNYVKVFSQGEGNAGGQQKGGKMMRRGVRDTDALVQDLVHDLVFGES